MAYLGEIIDDKYEVLREIGRGGMSIVYLAMDKRLNKQWAIKEFRKDKDDESKRLALKALIDEANLMKKLDHPTLPRIVDIIDTNNTVYIVMDYIEGESLNKVLDNYGAQPQEAVIEWGKQLSEVLDYLHTRVPPVIYRDMKPANIMLKPDGTVRLIDFGIAREYKEGKAGDTTSIGTRGYAAPEQFGDKGQTDARTDIYSFGVTLYHLVTGKNPAEPPYEIYPIRHWNPNLSSGLEWLIQKCTQLNPKDRYQSCAEVTYVLENLERFETAYKNKQRKKINLFLISIILTIVFGITGSVSMLLGRQSTSELYKSHMDEKTISGYQDAIDVDESQMDAYKALSEEMRASITQIKVGNYSSKEEKELALAEGIMYDKDIVTYFSNARLNIIEEEDINLYTKINYELGRLYWNNYDIDNPGSTASAKQALPYFENVIESASNSENNRGLSYKEYKLAQYYYLVSYFRTREKEMSTQDDGAFKVSDIAVLAGISGADTENNIANPFYSYWQTLGGLVIELEESDVTDAVKLNTLNIVANTIERNLTYFTEKNDKDSDTQVVDASSMETTYNRIADMIEVLDDKTNSQFDSKIAETKEVLKRLDSKIKAVFYNENMNLHCPK